MPNSLLSEKEKKEQHEFIFGVTSAGFFLGAPIGYHLAYKKVNPYHFSINIPFARQVGMAAGLFAGTMSAIVFSMGAKAMTRRNVSKSSEASENNSTKTTSITKDAACIPVPRIN